MFLHRAAAIRDPIEPGAQVEHADPGTRIVVLARRKGTKCTDTPTALRAHLSRRISPKSDNTCGRYGQKSIKVPKYRMASNGPTFNTVTLAQYNFVDIIPVCPIRTTNVKKIWTKSHLCLYVKYIFHCTDYCEKQKDSTSSSEDFQYPKLAKIDREIWKIREEIH